MYYIWIRSRTKQSEVFWTGTTWTSVQQFGKLYSLSDALKIMEKRFSRKYPKPLIQREGYFAERQRVKGKFNISKEKE